MSEQVFQKKIIFARVKVGFVQVIFSRLLNDMDDNHITKFLSVYRSTKIMMSPIGSKAYFVVLSIPVVTSMNFMGGR